MAHSKQSKKRIRQNEKRRLRNRRTTSTMRTAVKKLLGAATTGDQTTVDATLNSTLALIDKAAKRRVIHPNAAARKKSQAMRAANKLKK